MNNLSNWQQLAVQFGKNQRTPFIVAAVFAIFTLITIWLLINDFKSGDVKLPATEVVKPAHSINLAELHLMGIYDSKTADIPITQLQLTLEGTIVISDNPTQSRALIQSPDEPTKVYKIGDFLPGNAKLVKIDQQFVILNNDGQLQKLRLPIKVLPNFQLPGN